MNPIICLISNKASTKVEDREFRKELQLSFLGAEGCNEFKNQLISNSLYNTFFFYNKYLWRGFNCCYNKRPSKYILKLETISL